MLAQQLKRFLGFASTGAVATLIHYTLLVALTELATLAAFLASAIGYAISSTLNYLMRYHWVFRSNKKHRSSAPRYVLVALIGLSLNTLLMYLGTHYLSWHYLLIQIAVTTAVLIWNFAANSLWTFRATPS